MNLTILAVGNKMPNWVNEAVTEYQKRLGRDLHCTLKEIKPEKRTANMSAAQGMAAEEKRLREAIPNQAQIIALDERGIAPTSKELADLLQKWQDNNRDICFIIGGADGIAPALKSDANLLLRLSNLTLPHGMVRVLLLEQLYRAHAILQNHPYHRE